LDLKISKHQSDKLTSQRQKRKQQNIEKIKQQKKKENEKVLESK
jgi:hypothetical protein